MAKGRVDRLKEFYGELSEAEKNDFQDFVDETISGIVAEKQSEYELDVATDYIEEAKILRENWGKMQGISCGFKTIDALTKGIVGGETIVIGGATSSGKTTLAVNMAARMVNDGKRILFVTLEMTKAQLTSRVMIANRVVEPFLGNLIYQRNDELSWSSVDGLIAAAIEEQQVDMVIIDHLHYFTRELHNVAEDLGRITKEFKKNAIRYQVPIVIISHTRKGEGNSIDDLRGSSYIAQDADIVLMVERERDGDGKHILVSIVKNRNRGYDYEQNQSILLFNATKLSDKHDTPFDY